MVEPTIPRLPMDSFTFDRWRACDIWTVFGIRCRTNDIVNHRDILRQYAIGYCSSETLLVRPKSDETAVMFLINDVFGWTHLRNSEFEEVFHA